MDDVGNRYLSETFMTDDPLLMIMDGHAMVHRAWHAISVRQQLTSSKTGENTTAVYGFSNTFMKAIEEWKPSHCIMGFDLPGPTFRHRMYESYKSQRPPTPPELIKQFKRIRDLMGVFEVPIIEAEGYEADDVIGTLCREAEEKQTPVIILTGDTDSLQLVSPWVRVLLSYSVGERKIYDEVAVRNRYGGLGPSQIADFKAIKGDPSDNIPGIPGLGEKAAIKLLLEYDSIDGIYQNLDQILPIRVRDILERNTDEAFQCKKLTTIVRDAPVELNLDASRFGDYDRGRVLELFRELDFLSMAKRIPDQTRGDLVIGDIKSGPYGENLQKCHYRQVNTHVLLEELVHELKRAKKFAFDTETTGLDPMNCELVGISFAVEDRSAWYIPVGHANSDQIPLAEVLESIRPIFKEQGISKVGHNLNFDVMILGNYDIEVHGPWFDTMIAAHLLGKKSVGLKNLVLDIFHQQMVPISDLIGKGANQKTMDQISIEDVLPYACADADFTWQLGIIFEDQLRTMGLWDLFTTVEMPLVQVLVDMQRNGILLEPGVLQEMSLTLKEQLGRLELGIYDSVGHTFNIGSPQQLSEVLFNELSLPKTKRTKTGYSTDARSLEDLKDQHPVIGMILDYRQLSKLKSTYVDTLPKLVNPRTLRIHTSYNQAGASTGRISSSDPNLQNIPVRTELGREVRRAFVAPQGKESDWMLISADYSQIELRVLAHLSGDQSLVDAFHRDEDIHTSTASMMFDVPISEVTIDHRRIAKVMNFGVIYGLSPYGISQQTKFSPEEGRRFIETYFSKYPGIKDYIGWIKDSVRKNGYVDTILGRRRYMPEMMSTDAFVRQAGERVAVNMPIQGSAADIMKLAMIRVYRKIQESSVQSKMLLQVHDELILEVPRAEIETLREVVINEMANPLDGFTDFLVPLKVDIKIGSTWGTMEPL